MSSESLVCAEFAPRLLPAPQPTAEADADDQGSIADQIVAMVPWRVVGKLMPGARLIPARTAPGRATPLSNQSGSQTSRDLAAYDFEFRQMRKDEKLRLRAAAPTQRRFRSSRLWGG